MLLTLRESQVLFERSTPLKPDTFNRLTRECASKWQTARAVVADSEMSFDLDPGETSQLIRSNISEAENTEMR